MLSFLFKHPLVWLTAIFASSGVILSLFKLCYDVLQTEAMDYSVVNGNILDLKAFFCVLVIIIMANVLILRRTKLDFRQQIARCLAPGLLTIPYIWLPLSPVGILALALSIVLIVWNLTKHWHIPSIGKKTAWSIVAVVAAVEFFWGIYMQKGAFATLWFRTSDWSFYAIEYVKLTSEWLRPWKFFYNAGHFHLLPNIILVPWFTLFPDITLIFYVNSLLIAAIFPCVYYLLRSYQWQRNYAIIVVVSLFFHFTLVNQHLSFFYGYHPIIWFVPLALLFFSFKRRGYNNLAWTMMILSLLVQETVAAVWFGYGFMLMFKCGKRKQAVILSLLMVLWFMIAVKVLIPLGNLQSNQVYEQAFHFSNLGNNIPQVALSPFLRPQAFLNELIQKENFYFITFMIIPFIPLILSSGIFLLSTVPLLSALILMNGNELLNLSTQYQLEVFTLLIVASAIGVRRARRNFSYGGVYAFFAGCLILGACWGRLPYGKYGFFNIYTVERDASTVIKEIKQYIPQGATLMASPQLAMHFLVRNPVLCEIDYSDKELTADYILFYTRDSLLSEERGIEFIKQVVKSNRYTLMKHEKTKFHEYLLFRRH